MAIDKRRNIIPLMMEGFDFGSPATKEALTGKLAFLSHFNGVGLNAEYFFAGMEKLRNRYLKITLENVPSVVLSVGVEEETEERIARASKEPVVEEKSLTAEEWFERGYQSQKENNFDEAIRYYRKSTQLDPKLDAAYNNSGILLKTLERYEEAEASYRKAIELNPSDATAYSNLGFVRQLQDDFDGAIVNYRKALELKEDYGIARMSLFGLLKKMGREEEAKEQEMLTRELIQKENEYNRACFESLCGNVDEALALLKIALEKGQSSAAWARQDPDLENLRDDPRFKALIGDAGAE